MCLQGVALRCLPCQALLLNAQVYRQHLVSKVRLLKQHACMLPVYLQPYGSIEARPPAAGAAAVPTAELITAAACLLGGWWCLNMAAAAWDDDDSMACIVATPVHYTVPDSIDTVPVV